MCIGTAIKDLLSDFQKKQKMNESIQSIEDMQNFMVRFPEIRSQSVMVSKHVALMSELARLVDLYQLLDISQLEQDIACSSDKSNHRKQLLEKLNNPRIQQASKLKLVLLYLIRYENADDASNFKRILSEQGLLTKSLETIDALMSYAGNGKRADGLFSGGGLISQLSKNLKSSISGVDNVYTQHVPVLYHIIDSILKNTLSNSNYPIIQGNNANIRPTEVVIFMVGGVTMEEATKVSELNAANSNIKIILGGSTIHNSTSFLKEVAQAFRV